MVITRGADFRVTKVTLSGWRYVCRKSASLLWSTILRFAPVADLRSRLAQKKKPCPHEHQVEGYITQIAYPHSDFIHFTRVTPILV